MCVNGWPAFKAPLKLSISQASVVYVRGGPRVHGVAAPLELSVSQVCVVCV